MRNSISTYSSIIGQNRLLVQGAGGNISWKEGNTLWIKASGTWLAEANNRDIFIPLNLKSVRHLIELNETDLTSTHLTKTTLRPSIETSLHALLPHRIVVHIHAIDVIALAVCHNAITDLTQRLNGLNWIWIDYAKPGLELTKQIAAAIANIITPDIIVLGNHGLVVAGNTIEEIDKKLNDIIGRCYTAPRTTQSLIDPKIVEQLSTEWNDTHYHLPNDAEFHSLAIDNTNLFFARHKWVMYPDHAIFLGGQATVKNAKPPRDFLADHISYVPPCIIIANQGLVVHKDFNKGQQAMLRCYIDVISRISNPDNVASLNHQQIEELIHWDAEKYRQTVNSII